MSDWGKKFLLLIHLVCSLKKVYRLPWTRDSVPAAVFHRKRDYLAARMRCTAVFEIGTYSGRTTYNLACNTLGIVYTLDLSPTTRDTLLPVEKADHAFMGIEDSQRYWIGKPQADRIVQLRGDSADFDFTPYYKRMDLVFVDGSHAYHYVRKDSESALAMVRDSGAIVWHDYAPCWPGVVRALNELASRVSLVNLKGTSLVVYRDQ